MISIGSLIFSINGLANDEGKELFLEKCTTCHTMSFPKNKADIIAPPAHDVMFHMRENLTQMKKYSNI